MDWGIVVREIVLKVLLVCIVLGGSILLYKKLNLKGKQRGYKRWIKYVINGVAVFIIVMVILYVSLMGYLSVRIIQTMKKTEEYSEWLAKLEETHYDANMDVVEIQEKLEPIPMYDTTDMEWENEILAEDTDDFWDSEMYKIQSERELVRERPVLSGESLWSIAGEVYGDPYKWTNIYEQNKALIGENPNYIQKGQYLVMPEGIGYTDSEVCFAECNYNIADWEGIVEYIDPDCGYDIETCIFYYTLEGNGEQFKICYPKLIALNGKDVSAVNEGIRERAMKYADEMLINRTAQLEEQLRTDEMYDYSYVCSNVNYIISYLDEDVISVVFQDDLFLGSIYLEDYEMRTYVADINTGIRYKNEDLWTNLGDQKLAEIIYDDMASQHEESEYEMQIFDKVLDAGVMQEVLQTDGFVDGRHFMNTFLTEEGVGFSLSYRVGEEIDGNYSIMRGWTKTILPREQTIDYQTDAVIWIY